MFGRLQTDEETDAGASVRESVRRLWSDARATVAIAWRNQRRGRFCRSYMVARYFLGFVAFPLEGGRRLTLSVSIPTLTGTTTVRTKTRAAQSDMFVFQNVYLHQFYSAAIPHVPEPVECIVDLGANTGQSAQYLQAQFPTARVICVEPVEESVSILRENAQGLGWTIVPAAITPSDGWVQLGLSTWWGSASIVERVWLTRQARRNRFEASGRLDNRLVPAVSMPTVLAEVDVDHVDLLKIDIEGAELELLTVDADWLARVRCVVIEVHEKYLSRGEVHDALVRAGFALVAEGPCSVYVRA